MIPDQYKDRFAYHFTLLENLDSILTDGILSTNEKIKKIYFTRTSPIKTFKNAEAGCA